MSQRKSLTGKGILMMSGNNLFMKRQARTIDLLNELENTATPFIIHQTEVDLSLIHI